MTQQNMQKDNIVCLDSWRSNHETDGKEKELQTSLKNMSFGDLLEESSKTVEDLDRQKLDEENTLRSKMIIKEFGRRLEGQSMSLSKSFGEMRRKLEKKLLDLNRLI